MTTCPSRRQAILGLGASLVALSGGALAAPARKPRGNPLQQLFAEIPGEVRALLPGEAFEASRFVDAILSLESEAKTLRLPPSLLSRGEGTLPTSVDSLYELALPRLVALIDRAEFRALPFADKAGALLSRLNATQRVVPEGLTGPPVALARPMSLMALDQPATPATPALQLPIPTQPLATPPAEPGDADVPTEIRRSLRFDDLAGEYDSFFRTARLRPEHAETADWHMKLMRQYRTRYEAVTRRTGVPWHFVATVHGLEASFNFRGHLHNGDFPLSQRTRQVPAGRPLAWLPPSDWESSAIDALRMMGFAGQQDWSLPRTLYRLEAYNGFGYRRIGRVTPYLWSFSNHYERGKFVADGKFSATARSQQCGAAVLLRLMSEAGEIALG